MNHYFYYLCRLNLLKHFIDEKIAIALFINYFYICFVWR